MYVRHGGLPRSGCGRPERMGHGRSKRASRLAVRRERGGEERGGSSAVRMRLLDGAAQAFGRKGYAQTRVEDILEASGLSRPTFYKFFRNKDVVFNALAEMALLSLVQGIKNAVAAVSDPVAKLEKATDAFLRWRVSTGPFGVVLDMESRRPSSYAAAQRRMAIEAVTAVFDTEVRNARQRGIDPLIYAGLIAALESIGNTLLDRPNPSEEEIERCKKVMLRILVGSLAPGPAAP